MPEAVQMALRVDLSSVSSRSRMQLLALWTSVIVFQIINLVAAAGAGNPPEAPPKQPEHFNQPAPENCFKNCNCSGIVTDAILKSVEVQCWDSPVVSPTDSIRGYTLANAEALTVLDSPFLTSIPDAFCAFQAITSLHWVDGGLESVSLKDLNCFDQVQAIDFAGNNIREFLVGKSNSAPGVDGIDQNNNTIVPLTNSTFSRQRRLVRLDLSRNTLQSIAFETLQGLVELTHLNLSQNLINWIESKAFIDLQKLTTLDLSDNDITDIDAVLRWPALGSLTFLDLSRNSIRTLSSGLFDHLVAVQEINLSHNKIGDVRIGVFNRYLQELKVLQLQYNDLTFLASGTFADLCSIESLNVSHNALEIIGDTAFTSATWAKCRVEPDDTQSNNYGYDMNQSTQKQIWYNLRVLDISHNQLTAINTSFFQSSISNVKELHLEFNKLSHLPRYSVEYLINLERIHLQHNVLDWLDVGIFKNEHLKSIDLSYNKLKKLISMVFLYLPSIEDVELQHNELNFIYSYSFYKTCGAEQPATTIRLNLNDNHLSSDAIWRLVSTFRHLGGSKCSVSISMVNNQISHFLKGATETYQHHLNLLDYSYFETWDRVKLDVRNNPIRCDCQTFKDINLLMKVKKTFLETFQKTSNVEFWRGLRCMSPKPMKSQSLEVALEKHKVCTVSDDCPNGCTCTMVRDSDVIDVDCKNQMLQTLPDIWPEGKKRIYLQGNSLYYIPDTADFPDVEFIDLSHNHINTIDDNAWGNLAYVHTVLLHDNSLQTLPDSIENAYNISNLTIFDNPFICDCENLWIKYWFKNHTGSLHRFDDIRCGEDGYAVGESLVYLQDWRFMCVQVAVRGANLPIKVIALGTVGAIMGLITIAVLLYIYRRQVTKVMRGNWQWNQFDDVQEAKSDIFVAFSSADTEYVEKEIVAKLIGHNPPYSVYLQHHDWAPCLSLQDTLAEVMRSTEVMLVVITQNFLQSDWSNPDFKSTLKQALYSDRNNIYLVLVDPVSPDDLDSDLQAYMANNSYFRTSDEYVWERLFYILPEPRSSGHILGKCFDKQHFQSVTVKF